MKFSRRKLLRGAAAVAALPLLESMTRSRALAAADSPRFVIFQSGQGTLLNRWTPAAGENLVMSELLQGLTPFRDKLNVISGVNNLLPRYHLTNGHIAQGHTLLNAHLCTSSASDEGGLLPAGSRREVSGADLCVGPSIDHYMADRLGLAQPFNFALPRQSGGENQMFYQVAPELPSRPNGSRVLARVHTDPRAVFDTHLMGLGGEMPPPPEPMRPSLSERIRARRASTIGATQAVISELSPQVSLADRDRLEAYAARLSEIDTTVTPPMMMPPPVGTSCNPVAPVSGYPDSTTAHYRASIDVMVELLACNVTRIATIQDTEYHGPSFDFLQSPISGELSSRGAIALPGGAISNWHQQIHGDSGGNPNDNPTLRAGFLFYASQFAYLLERMDAIVEPGGGTLLDNSIVMWISEFGDGSSHSTDNLPVVLAGGACGTLTTGRHLAQTGKSTGDLYTSILRKMGVPADTFGLVGDSDLQTGGLTGF